jgi:tryptophan-rich sensory protein
MDWLALSVAVCLCLVMAGAEGLLTGNDLPQWLASLRHPRFYAPMWVWILAAIITYAMQGFIAYRLVARSTDLAGAVALVALVTVMAANVAYNVVLARTHSPRMAYTGVLWFLPPLAILQFLLVFIDATSAGLNAIYVAWVIGYDLPIMRALWKLNA